MVRKAVDETLSDLGLKQLDLYLVHWPIAFVNDGTGNSAKDANGVSMVDKSCSLTETWKAMEALVDAGLVKSIGVSNFSISKLKLILEHARIKPAVNQVNISLSDRAFLI